MVFGHDRSRRVSQVRLVLQYVRGLAIETVSMAVQNSEVPFVVEPPSASEQSLTDQALDRL